MSGPQAELLTAAGLYRGPDLLRPGTPLPTEQCTAKVARVQVEVAPGRPRVRHRPSHRRLRTCGYCRGMTGSPGKPVRGGKTFVEKLWRSARRNRKGLTTRRRKSFRCKVPETGLEPALPVKGTRPSTWRVCQFRHSGAMDYPIPYGTGHIQIKGHLSLLSKVHSAMLPARDWTLLNRTRAWKIR